MGILTTLSHEDAAISSDHRDICSAGYRELGSVISAFIDRGFSANLAHDIRALLAPRIDRLDCLPFQHPVPAGCYERRIMFLDRKQRFTILGLQWMPGARTPIHGHRAWGVVGVIDGEIDNISYELRKGCTNNDTPTETGRNTAKAGSICTVAPAPASIHALHNSSDHPVTTVHIYGMDLSRNHTAINKLY